MRSKDIANKYRTLRSYSNRHALTTHLPSSRSFLPHSPLSALLISFRSMSDLHNNRGIRYSSGEERVPMQSSDAPFKPPVPAPASNPLSPHIKANTLSIGDVLAMYKNYKPFTIAGNATLLSAIQLMVASRVGCLMITDKAGKGVEGLLTERDILKVIGKGDGLNALNQPIAEYMTPAADLLHVQPQESTSSCLSLMCAQGVRHLPVLEEGGGVKGMVSMRNIVDVLYRSQLEDKGVKSMVVNDILPRVGLPSNTRLSLRPPSSLYLHSSVYSIPHPAKKEKGGEDTYIIMNRGIGKLPDVQLPLQPWHANPITPSPPASDPPKSSTDTPKKRGKKATSNDSTIVSNNNKAEAGEKPTFSVIAVFDGVGSWSFEQNIDPSNFSKALAQGTANCLNNGEIGGEGNKGLTPQYLLSSAYHHVLSQKVPGSSTSCILLLTSPSNELKAINIGDSGFIVCRKSKMGSMGTIHKESDYQIIYRSPQQLHYFNCPYQLGNNLCNDNSAFDTPSDAEIINVTIQEGDIVVLATDGLFDNLTEHTILSVLSQQSSHLSSPSPTIDLSLVAKQLTKTALEASLDKMTDSPFAVLAKDNNIMW